MMRINIALIALVFMTLSLGGCATTRHYKDTLPHNLKVTSKIESVKAALDIYSVGQQCKITYLGTVDIDQDLLEIGIATGKASYLVVSFTSSSFWSSSSGFTHYDISLLPRKAYRYLIDVSYIDNIYNVTVYEINQLSGEKREMEGKELQNCGS